MNDKDDRTRPVRALWGLPDVLVWLAIAVLMAWALSQPMSLLILGSSSTVQILGTVLAWLVLIVGVLVASYLRGQRSLARDFGLRWRWIDIVWGVLIGLLLRAVSTLVEIGISGRLPSTGATLANAITPVIWLVLLAAGSALISPFVEELFFRGLALRSILRNLPRGTDPLFAKSIAVVGSSLLFAFVHVLTSGSVGAAATVGSVTLIAGISFGALAVSTGRLGGAIIAHVVFNTSGLVLSLLL